MEELKEILTKNGGNPNVFYEKTDQPLLVYASKHGYLHWLEHLLMLGADVNIKNEDEDTALIVASKKGHKDIAEMLLAAGADVNLQTEYGDTALMIASMNDHEDIVELIENQPIHRKKTR